MKIVCLMPTYGRRASLLENSIQLFLNQTYPNKHLMICDDLGTLGKTRYVHPDVTIMSAESRSNGLGDKYNFMARLATVAGAAAVAVWDDDDVYLSHHLAAHARVLAQHAWSKPKYIISAHAQPPAVEEASGRFHGSIAVRIDMLKRIDAEYGSMWEVSRRCNYDQNTLARFYKDSEPGDSSNVYSYRPRTYVYRWQTTQSGHCSGVADGDDWYDRYRPDSTTPIEELVPKFDVDTQSILRDWDL